MALSKAREFIDLVYFGKQIAALRKGKRLSQWQVAKSADISQSVLGKIESGQSMPMLSTALSIAEFFEVDLFELIKYSSPSKDDIRSFYARFRMLERLTHEQAKLIIAVATHMVNKNQGISYVDKE
jgi:transcriptional regulator with XRE-family HTH domain